MWRSFPFTMVVLVAVGSAGFTTTVHAECNTATSTEPVHQKLLLIDLTVVEAMSHIDTPTRKDEQPGYRTHAGGVVEAPDGTLFAYGSQEMENPAMRVGGVIWLRPDTDLETGKEYLATREYAATTKVSLPEGTDPEAFQANYERMQILLGEPAFPTDYETRPLHDDVAFEYFRTLLEGKTPQAELALYPGEWQIMAVSLGLNLPLAPESVSRARFQEIYGVDKGNELYDKAQSLLTQSVTP